MSSSMDDLLQYIDGFYDFNEEDVDYSEYWGGNKKTEPYEKKDVDNKCVCDIKLLMIRGCQCGGFQKEMKSKEE